MPKCIKKLESTHKVLLHSSPAFSNYQVFHYLEAPIMVSPLRGTPRHVTHLDFFVVSRRFLSGRTSLQTFRLYFRAITRFPETQQDQRNVRVNSEASADVNIRLTRANKLFGG